LIPFTVVPSFISRHGMILFLSILFNGLRSGANFLIIF